MENIKIIQCPYCGEHINSMSKFCEYCGESIDTIEFIQNNEVYNSKESNLPLKKYLLIVILSTTIICIIFVALWLISSNLDVNVYDNNNKEAKPSVENKNTNKFNENDIEKAKQLINDEKYIEAGEILQQAIDINQDPIANYYMGEIYRAQGYYKIAIQYYQNADKNKRNFFEAKKRLAQTFFDYNNREQALVYANSAYSIKPKDKELLETLISIYKYEDDSEKLFELNNILISIDPNNYDALNYVAGYYLENEQFKQAAHYIEKILKIDFNINIAYALAYCYAKIEYYTQAIKVLNEIQEYDSSEYYRVEQYKENISLLREKYNYEHGRYY